MTLRIIAAFIMILLIALAPWWLTVLISLCALFYFNSYYEIILWGIALDALYGTPYAYMYTIASVTAFTVIYFVKRHARERSRRNTI